jgi:lipid-A-disaccharide synthase
MIRIGIVAGETSGDMLGANLIRAIKNEYSEIEVVGIGGEQLTDIGCKSLYPMERLSVMGIVEVFHRLFDLMLIRHQLKKYFISNPPDIFIGIDSPDFNLPLEHTLHKAGIKTLHYVSPSVWAWREGRLKTITKSVDLMFALFPFEVPFYEKNNIPVMFVGHPLAEKINMQTDKFSARERLSLPQNKKIVAIMPGSRNSEMKKLIEPFIKTAAWCNKNMDDTHFITGLIDEHSEKLFSSNLEELAPDLSISLYIGRSLDVMAAADVILLASGTITLEAMLLKRPMVVAYKLNWITYQVAKRMVKVPYISLPNLLAGRQVVPECLQERCVPEIMGPEVLKWLKNDESVNDLEDIFRGIHQNMKVPESSKIADAVLNLVNG